ncbi:hypothetical protein EK21DRAFT_106046 [Setomelanomma holmii]|uniref:Uncharacterized protein n=1 Tax=Setomelanomma holmii TaxID=210430 RepID=A0A9P4HNG6_9PLEO|nr:hypothetical protein EK21DRAFT_106046 [Setomelanomma holmii]
MLTSRAFRRSFVTTARLLQKPNNKPLAPPHNEPPPPPPRNDPEPPEEPNSATEELNKAKKDLKEKVLGTFKPSSPEFLFAFANPKLPWEKRRKSGLLFAAATLLALLIPDPFGTGDKTPEVEKRDTMVEMIQTAFVEKDRLEAQKGSIKH